MNPFETLIHELGTYMNIPLEPDNHQSCLITFPNDDISIQIDLDSHADSILVGTQLGRLTPGPYRLSILRQAMRANGIASTPRGVLSYSEKNDTLIIFQLLPISTLTGEKLHKFLQLFKEHALVWKQALDVGNVPSIQADVETIESRMFGLRP